MESNDTQNGHGPSPQAAAGQQKSATQLSADASRRRMLMKAGLLAVPMIVTLRSRPAHAQAALGSLGIFYGEYDVVEEGGQQIWAPVDENGEVVRDEFGNIDYTRRSQETP
jgi:hypothetical protein